MSTLEPYQTGALILLIGANPLPNYVAARLLLKRDGMLYLVHSQGPDGTGIVAQRLAAQFPDNNPRLIAVNPLDTAGLQEKVKKSLQDAPADSLGLNYTGGTKVMAVHTYQAVADFCGECMCGAVFSYLDAETLELIVEPRTGHPVYSTG